MNSVNITEESEDSDVMARHESELESEGRHRTRMYRGCRQKQPEERRSYHDVGSSECYCEQMRKFDLPELERRPRRRTKSQMRHYAFCNHPQEMWNHSMERVNYPQNVDATLNTYQHLLDQTTKKSQSYCYNPHLRKRQMSVHRRSRKGEQDEMMSAMRNTIDFDASPRVCCEYDQSAKNIHSRDIEEIEQSDDQFKYYEMMKRILENLDMRKHFMKNGMQQNKERMLRPEAWTLRQHPDKINKLEANGKKQFSDDDNRDSCRGKLRFDLPDCEHSKEIDLKNIEEDRENQTRRKPNAVPNKPFAMKSNLKTSCFQTLSKNKNTDDLFDQKNLMLDRSQEEDAPKEMEDRSANKLRKQSIVRQNCKPNEEVTSGNRKEIREEIPYELIMKDEEEEENSIRKNIYGGGDLELRATKSQILSLIDRAISNEFGKMSDQQQSPDSSRGIAGEEIYIEIMRVLRSNCCQSVAEDLLSHHEPSADCIKLLKMLRWDHMTHIQEEFRKLCNLQKFLDTYSPRQSLPAFQSYPVAVEQQRPEERQQQHEEKQTSGTIP